MAGDPKAVDPNPPGDVDPKTGLAPNAAGCPKVEGLPIAGLDAPPNADEPPNTDACGAGGLPKTLAAPAPEPEFPNIEAPPGAPNTELLLGVAGLPNAEPPPNIDGVEVTEGALPNTEELPEPPNTEEAEVAFGGALIPNADGDPKAGATELVPAAACPNTEVDCPKTEGAVEAGAAPKAEVPEDRDNEPKVDPPKTEVVEVLGVEVVVGVAAADPNIEAFPKAGVVVAAVVEVGVPKAEVEAAAVVVVGVTKAEVGAVVVVVVGVPKAEVGVTTVVVVDVSKGDVGVAVVIAGDVELVVPNCGVAPKAVFAPKVGVALAVKVPPKIEPVELGPILLPPKTEVVVDEVPPNIEVEEFGVELEILPNID